GNADRKQDKHKAAELPGVFAETPEGHEIKIGGVQHQFDSDEHQDRVATSESASETNAEKQGRDDEVLVEWAHGLALLSSMAINTAPIIAAVRSKPITSKGKM